VVEEGVPFARREQGHRDALGLALLLVEDLEVAVAHRAKTNGLGSGVAHPVKVLAWRAAD
jgi:hydrogenase/urease accessory protein HupE